jgi:HEAT repeat protein
MPLKSASSLLPDGQRPDGQGPDDQAQVERQYPRDRDGLIAQLGDADPGVRRWAARDLGRHPEAVPALAARLSVEAAPAVREAILDALLAIATDEAVEEMLVFLRSEDAALRNGAVAVLQQLPDPVSRQMQGLLADADPDVRIMAIDILQTLAHPEAPTWLADLLQHERQVNVVGAAIDRLAEIGTEDMLPLLDEVRDRFADEPYIQFATDTVIRRIRGGSSAA